MKRTIIRTLVGALAIVVASAAIAIASNWARRDGIALVAAYPYDIFAPCKDSEAKAQTVSGQDLVRPDQIHTLYVDARPLTAFAAEHVQGAIHVPYSLLFGASEADLARLKSEVSAKKPTSILVYGLLIDPAAPGEPVDLGKSLAAQLVEAKLTHVQHVQGGLDTLKKSGVKMVQSQGATP